MTQHIRQRRALYTVLKQWLDDTSVMKALLVFEQHHQGKPSIAVHAYLTDIAPLHQGIVEAKTIRRELMKVLVRESAELAPDPLPQMIRFRDQDNTNIEAGLEPTADQLVLHELVTQVMRKTTSSQRKSLHTEIATQLGKRFVNGSYDRLASYLLSENPRYLASFDDRALRDFLNVIYVSACSVLGPVETDRCFANSILTVRQNHSGLDHSINRYL